jgi:hypothetical protein
MLKGIYLPTTGVISYSIADAIFYKAILNLALSQTKIYYFIPILLRMFYKFISIYGILNNKLKIVWYAFIKVK